MLSAASTLLLRQIGRAARTPETLKFDGRNPDSTAGGYVGPVGTPNKSHVKENNGNKPSKALSNILQNASYTLEPYTPDLPFENQEGFEDLVLRPDWYEGAVLWSTDWTAETIIGQLKKGAINLNPRYQRRNA